MHIIICSIFLSSIFQVFWQETRSNEWGFKIEAPIKLEEKASNLETDIGKINSTVFYYQDESIEPDNYIYMVTCMEYPEGSMHSDSTELLSDFFDASVEEAVLSIDGELIYQSDYNYEEYPGRIWRISYNENTAIIKSVSYIVKNKLYIIQTASLKEKAVNKSANRFVDSFRLL